MTPSGKATEMETVEPFTAEEEAWELRADTLAKTIEDLRFLSTKKDGGENISRVSSSKLRRAAAVIEALIDARSRAEKAEERADNLFRIACHHQERADKAEARCKELEAAGTFRHGVEASARVIEDGLLGQWAAEGVICCGETLDLAALKIRSLLSPTDHSGEEGGEK